MALQTWNDADVKWNDTFTTWNGEAMDSKFYMRNNQLTTISGADAGTYVIKNNKVTVKISSIDYTFNPLSRVPSTSGYLFHKYGDIFTERIKT